MKKLMVILMFGWCTVAGSWAADGISTFQSGLRAFQEYGPDALLNTWYGSRDDAEKIAALRAKLVSATRFLGMVVDTEVFAPVALSRNVQRLYGVIYFEKRPLWVRADFYSLSTRSGFISLEFSLSPDEILPVNWPELRR
jgi:hypothetical protein